MTPAWGTGYRRGTDLERAPDMPDLLLRPAEQEALRQLMTAEPVPGRPLPTEHVLLSVSRLVPCDTIGAVLVEGRGPLLDSVDLPPSYADEFPPDGDHSGPLYLGVMHWSRNPRAAAACGTLEGATDAIAIGFRNGPDGVVQIAMNRKTQYFETRDLAMLHLLLPVLQRLVRERATPQLPASLTVQERRVLTHVAAGRSNADIAAALFIAPSTVRKHLEHAFRKLGVNSRLAAVARLQGRDLPDLDLAERLERYA